MVRNNEGIAESGDKLSKNFNLTEADFATMREQLKEGDEKLFEQIYLSHFSDCMSFLQRNLKVSHEESYDATMQTMLNFRRAIILDKIYYGNLRYHFTRMAKFHILKTKGKLREFSTDEIEIYQIADDTPEEHEEREVQIDTLSEAIETLNEEDKALLVAHYYNKNKLIDIAKSIGVNDATMRKRKQRIISKLKAYFSKELH